ncbi:MAG: hypothetical protein ACR2M1_15650 [Gemmatimonadaceae bacterium]
MLRDAVLAAILFRWSNGQVESHVNRRKLIKRTTYRKAGFQLLRNLCWLRDTEGSSGSELRFHKNRADPEEVAHFREMRHSV